MHATILRRRAALDAMRWCLGPLLMVALMLLATTAQARQPERDAIQVLASYHRGSPWSDELVDRITEAADWLEWQGGVNVDYLDARRLDESAAFELHRRRLAGREAVRPASRLLLIDDAALRFYLDHAQALGGPERVVAIGINAPSLRERAMARGVKLILTQAVAERSLDFLEELFGVPLPLLVLGDSTGSGEHLTREFLASLEAAEGAHLAQVLWDWTPADVVSTLSALPARTRVYLVEGQTTGAADLRPDARRWLHDLADRDVRVFCHLPYQVRLGCAGGAILDTRRLTRLAVETLVSPAFSELPTVQDVRASRRMLHASFHAQVPADLREELEWLEVEGVMASADTRLSQLTWGGVAFTGLLLLLLLMLVVSRRRARRAHHRLAVDPATGLPTRQLLEAEFDELRSEGDGWLFALMSPGLRDYRQHVGLPGAQALFREQLPALRESLPRECRLYVNADLGVIGFLSADQGESGEVMVDRCMARLSQAPAGHRVSWYASLLRLSGMQADFAQCRAALDDGLFRLERQGWRQPVIRVEPMEREEATRFRQLSEALETLIDHPDAQWRLVVQPKVSPLTGELSGAEVLLRWRHPELGDIAPLEFLPVVEILGMASRLDHWVMTRGLDWLARHRERLPGLTHLAINVNLATLSEPAFQDRLTERLSALALPPSMVELEITEHADFRDLDAIERVMAPLRDHGVRLALDDFGTGHTAFRLLQRLPFMAVKMDRSLLLAAGERAQAQEAYAAMVYFAERLGLSVVAEGVESDEQAEWLAGLGIGEVQGFRYARPMELNDFMAAYGIAAAPNPE
ncbi:EAL domain-containing protein [Billgrantia gudaonensis]|uniref:EAL domain, c-di-GMP-specific phosphodiesterase class I (Or its enzymatically inactive variant) n=1 Tax=Billgrantia gudaonensis TaxID=376427 RepID=A0A1G8YB73_9GAMM|nr:EAL domain-containing protein [Halomonas gudaonensis]SDJ99971.1 EAL domain, c-di-GMP-specific phosphodiesterase class I (or its enzymatically inactive variant) [Halomonas gudaonensis]